MLLSLSRFASAEVNFDQGVNVRNIVEEASVSEVKAPEAKFIVPSYTFRDCKKITFTETSPLTSPTVRLSSTEMYQDCQNTGYPPGQICFPHTNVYREDVRIVITEPRTLNPGQTEVFEVCLWGQFLSLKQITPAYKYREDLVLSEFRLTPQAKAADAKGGAQDYCSLVIDTVNSCSYQCKDGSWITKPNPFPSTPPWVPFHGCPPSVPNTAL
ncbi:MAG: hypothetical protein A2X28_07530 [Elusimicrobia bacterium GWA2_56_46]|nr:MAG: hypothetical protein A2X28_07530 [Elusimicrobia bacterium GWA2_56_46]OGR55656.1 MAG: hypothetical protein A2X39_04655 [Elusimicrobia bacterium GWC2_56_31]HBB66678.1 hypothetical protein [Elusimicrobiota bacterium]HBW23532.1 hypothetical protein [Elusimicrobiota bacterium]